MIISDNNDLWQRYPPFIEYNVGELLEHNYDLSPINYYKVPWSGMHRVDRDINMIKIGGHLPSVTMCQQSGFKQFIYAFEKLGITDVFTPHCDSIRLNSINIHPIAHQPMMYIKEAYNILMRPYLYSFVGMVNNCDIRRTIRDMVHPEDTMMIYRNRWAYEITPDTCDGLFSKSLLHAKFVLCPRGWGSGTIRFWEALKSACIPVIFEDIVLPDNVLWDSTIVRHYDGLDSLEDHLRSISADELLHRSKSAKLIAKSYLDDQMVKPIVDRFNLVKIEQYHGDHARKLFSGHC